MNSRKDPTQDRYLNGDYSKKNPDWDSADADWKASKLTQLLTDHGCSPETIVEIGCGSGAVLAALRKYFPKSLMTGFDIAPEAQRFWKQNSTSGIHFVLGDYFTTTRPAPDLVLLLDVLEHLGNPWELLVRLRSNVKLLAVHFPLDLSALSVLRESPLLRVRDKVGHLHYFTRGLALELLEECGFYVIESRYTGASLNAPQRSVKTRFAEWVRRAVYMFNKDLGVRLLGGETLMVLARPKSTA